MSLAVTIWSAASSGLGSYLIGRALRRRAVNRVKSARQTASLLRNAKTLNEKVAPVVAALSDGVDAKEAARIKSIVDIVKSVAAGNPTVKEEKAS